MYVNCGVSLLENRRSNLVPTLEQRCLDLILNFGWEYGEKIGVSHCLVMACGSGIHLEAQLQKPASSG